MRVGQKVRVKEPAANGRARLALLTVVTVDTDVSRAQVLTMNVRGESRWYFADELEVVK